MVVYINNSYKPLPEARISPFDRGFLFADGVYEVLRTYNKKLFRYDDHLERLKKCLREIRITYNKLSQIQSIINMLIRENNLKNEAVIYLQITRGESLQRTHSFPPEETQPTVFISAQDLKVNSGEQTNGVKVILHEDLRWLRCDIKSVSLLPVVLANQKATEAGAREAILFRNGLITEGTHTNFFAVKDNVVVTAPLSNLILEGITRRIVLGLCKEMNINVLEEHIRRNELKSYNEFFITSTTMEITPVVQIDDWEVNNKIPGVITERLKSSFKELTKRNR